MTDSATQFVSPLTFQALSGHPVHHELLNAEVENAMGHISLARWADILLIAPATANCIAKCSHGLADDLLSTLYLAANCPVYIVPAMNQAMWNKAVTQENIQKLQRHGVVLIGPEAGSQACGETGFGRMTEPEAIVDAIIGYSNPLLAGLKILITAGPTREALDPVRYITNRSSGKMGYALAQAAALAGAEVTLISGPVQLAVPDKVLCIQIESAAQMYEAVMENINNQAIFIGAAAVADYSPMQVEAGKIKKQGAQIAINLQKTPDILASVANLPQPPFTVGFAAETHDLETYAKHKLAAKKLDMIAANWVGQAEGGFDSHENALQVFWQDQQKSLPMMAKTDLAQQLLALIAQRFHEKNTI